MLVQSENKNGYSRSLHVNPDIEKKIIICSVSYSKPGTYKIWEYAIFENAVNHYNNLDMGE